MECLIVHFEKEKSEFEIKIELELEMRAYMAMGLDMPNPSSLIDGARGELSAGAVPSHRMDLK